jgi:hypothetical protein
MKNIIKLLMIVFIIIISTKYNLVFGQATIATNVNGALHFLGGDNNSAKSLDIGQENALSIDFYTSTGVAYPWLGANQKVTILGTAPNFDDGYFGIGHTNVTTFGSTSFPNNRLDVDSGDINVNLVNQGYRIGAGTPWWYTGGGNSYWVLWHGAAGNIGNINVGARAGLSSISQGSTFVGFSAGEYSAADSNTIVGCFAGSNVNFASNNMVT